MATEEKTGGAVEETEHDRKFDRQMRLWGGHGQKRLETAHICLVGSGPTGTETLKNVVLPNVGKFTIVDGQKVTPADLGNNFFVEEARLGDPRAQVCRDLLCEMNPDVTGEFLEKDPETLIEEDTSFFDKFNLVIATQLRGKALQTLADYTYEKGIPLVLVRANGLVGYVRVQLRELPIVEAHPTSVLTDLYLWKDQRANFIPLQEYIDSFKLDVQDAQQHGHVPAVAILGQLVQKWQDEHDGKLPEKYADKEAFKDGIVQYGFDSYKNFVRFKQTDDDGKVTLVEPTAPQFEANYKEAKELAYHIYQPPRVERSVQALLKDPAADSLTAESADFWVLVRALKDFLENEGKGFLPVSTSLPDLTAMPKAYVRLKEIFQARYEKDRDTIGKYAEIRLKEIGKDPSAIAKGDLDRFVKNCRTLKVVRLRSLKEENAGIDLEYLTENAAAYGTDWSTFGQEKDPNAAPCPKNINWYWALRANNEFYEKNGRVAGSGVIEEDVAELKVILGGLFTRYNITEEMRGEEKDKLEEMCLREIARSAGSEVHNVSAFLGGVASQAVLKLLLRQYSPLDNTLIYNGIHCQTSTFQF